MFQRGRLIRDSFASIGGLLALGGIGLLPIQYLVWRKIGVWPAMQVRTVFDLMSVATPQGVDAVLRLPLSIAMLIIGFLFIWIALEIYEPRLTKETLSKPHRDEQWKRTRDHPLKSH